MYYNVNKKSKNKINHKMFDGLMIKGNLVLQLKNTEEY